MTKTLVCSIPPWDISKPPLSGGILCAVCKKLGQNVTAVDLQVNLNKYLKSCDLPVDLLDDALYNFTHEFTPQQEKVLTNFISIEGKKIISGGYDYIIISLFSVLGQKFATKLLKYLSGKTYANRIIGGAGITAPSFDYRNSYGATLKKNNLIDCYITGEAEEALPMYFKVGQGPGINNKEFAQLDHLDQYAFPDYSCYDLNDYLSDTDESVELAIIGSRGCVRSCTFCDVVKTSPKYRFRSGNNIAKEIINHYETYGVTKFYFADSLVNGSDKMFNDMCNTLANYKFHEPISWKGQYILRNRKSVPKNHFELLKSSGCSELFVGIESGCDRIREEIGKKFTNDDIEFYLENFSKFDVKVLFLFFSGYVSETIKDHEETLRMFSRWQKYVATGTITGIETLNILMILPGSPLETVSKNSHFHFLENVDGSVNNLYWTNPDNPSLNFKERVRRHLEMIDEAIKYKWPIWNGELTLDLLYNSMLEYKQLSDKSNNKSNNNRIKIISID